jgi:hypothetical protein
MPGGAAADPTPTAERLGPPSVGADRHVLFSGPDTITELRALDGKGLNICEAPEAGHAMR